MYKCPITLQKLVPASAGGSKIWYSPTSKGRMITLAIARHFFGEHATREIWVRSELSKENISWKKCPCCSKHMTAVKEPRWVGGHEIDVCRRCRIFWIDGDEHIEVPKPEDLIVRGGDSTLLKEVIDSGTKAIMQKIEMGLADEEVIGSGPEGPLSYFALLGLPVQYDEHYYDRWPWISWFISLSFIVIFLISKGSVDSTIQNYGLIASDITHHPLRLFTWSFIHGDWFHLLFNVYFFGMMADDLEHYFGHIKFFILMILFPIITGAIAALLTMNSGIHLIGSSAVIMAMMILYAMIFRKSRVAFLNHYYQGIALSKGIGLIYTIGWFRVSLIWIMIFFVCKDLLWYLYIESHGMSLVAFVPHFTGVLTGLGAWILAGGPNWYTANGKKNNPDQFIISDETLMNPFKDDK